VDCVAGVRRDACVVGGSAEMPLTISQLPGPQPRTRELKILESEILKAQEPGNPENTRTREPENLRI